MAIPRSPKKGYLILAAPFIAGSVLAFLFLAFPLSIALGALFAFVAFGSLAKYLYDMWEYEYKPCPKEVYNAIKEEVSNLTPEQTLFPRLMTYVTKNSPAYYPTQFLDIQFSTFLPPSVFIKVTRAQAILAKEIYLLHLYEPKERPDFFSLSAYQSGKYDTLSSASTDQGIERAMRQRFLLHLIFLRLAINNSKKGSRGFNEHAGDFLPEKEEQKKGIQQVDFIKRLLKAPEDKESKEPEKPRINILEKFNPDYSTTGATLIFELALQSGRIPHLQALVEDLFVSDKYGLSELYEAYETITKLIYKDTVSSLTSQSGKDWRRPLQEKMIDLAGNCSPKNCTFLGLCKAYQILKEFKGDTSKVTSNVVQKLEEEFPEKKSLEELLTDKETLISAMRILDPIRFSPLSTSANGGSFFMYYFSAYSKGTLAWYVQEKIEAIDKQIQALKPASTPPLEREETSSRCCFPCFFSGGNSRKTRVAPHPSPAPTGQHSVQHVEV